MAPGKTSSPPSPINSFHHHRRHRLPFSISALLNEQQQQHQLQPEEQEKSPPSKKSAMMMPTTMASAMETATTLAECFPLIFGPNLSFGLAQLLAKANEDSKVNDEDDKLEEGQQQREDAEEVEEAEEEEAEEEEEAAPNLVDEEVSDEEAADASVEMLEEQEEQKPSEEKMKMIKQQAMDDSKPGMAEQQPMLGEFPLPPAGWLFAALPRAAGPNGPMPPLLGRLPCLPPPFGRPPHQQLPAHHQHQQAQQALLFNSLFHPFSTAAICGGGPAHQQQSGHDHHQNSPSTMMAMSQQSQQHKRKGGQIRFSNEQTDTLEGTFETNKYLTNAQRKKLAKALVLSERQVKTWFQNRRAKWRRCQPPGSSDCTPRPPHMVEGMVDIIGGHEQEQQMSAARMGVPAMFMGGGGGPFCGLSD